MKRIKKLMVACLLLLSSSTYHAYAQEIKVIEPDTASVNLMYYISSSNQLQVLPYENGEIKQHKNSFGKFASIAGNIADAAGALGGLGTIVGTHSGSISTALGGLEVMGAAGSVGNLANVADNLAGAEGHDFTYEGAKSSTVINGNGNDIHILVNLRCKDRESALSLFKVVRFKTTKKDRRLRWLQSKAALIKTEKTEEASKAGYIPFGYKSYGDHSSLLTIPANQTQKGEYGIYFLGNMFTPNLGIMCYTFSVE